MPHIPRVVCARCAREMDRVQSGISLEAITSHGSYYKIMCDKFSCPDCGTVVYSGFARQPFVEHYQEGYGAHPVDADFKFSNG